MLKMQQTHTLYYELDSPNSHLESNLRPAMKEILLAMMIFCDGMNPPDLQQLRRRVATYDEDGRISIVDLYRAQCELAKKPGWILEEVFGEVLLRDGERIPLPSTCLRTERTGPALWILTGIHGEEPAGPNALAENMAALIDLQQRGIPLVVLPLLNPLGYQQNWRYPDAAVYSATGPGSSVGDSDHLLPDAGGKARRPAPACRQSAMLTARVLELARAYPPRLVLDLHEDNLLQKGYLYSQGRDGVGDPAARAMITLLHKEGFPILREGKTRFGETVKDGIVHVTQDGSIDELLSAPAIVVNGTRRQGPAGTSVLVLETSSMNTPLAARKKIHATVLAALGELWEKANR
jgi:hypothetical protein